MGLLVRFGHIDTDRLAAAFDRVVDQAELLQSFVQIGSSNGQLVVDQAHPRQETEFCAIDRDELDEWARREIARPLALERSVYRSIIATHPDGAVSWLSIIHHVATDATASSLVVSQTADAYLGTDPPRSSFSSWVDARLDADAPAPSLVPDRPVNGDARHSGNAVRRSIDADIAKLSSAALQDQYRFFSDDLGMTALLIAASSILLASEGAKTARIGVPVHHRVDATAQQLIGPTLNIHPLELALDPDESCASLHKRVCRSLLDSLGHARPATNHGSGFAAVINVIQRASIVAPERLPFTVEWLATGAIDPDIGFQVHATKYESSEGAPDIAFESPATRQVTQWQQALEHLIRRPEGAVGDFRISLNAARAPHTERVTSDATGVDPLPRSFQGVAASSGATTELEHELIRRWQETLERDDVGIDDDFFALGGDSLGAITMLLALSDDLDFELHDEIFNHSTIRELAKVIDSDVPTRRIRPPFPYALKLSPPPLSAAELSIRYEAERTSDQLGLNLCRHYEMAQQVDPDRLADAVRTVARLHSALRWNHDEPRVELDIDDAVEIRTLPSPAGPPNDASLDELARESLDLRAGPVLRVHTFSSNDLSTVTLVLHHVCGDKQSLDVLWREIDAVYHGRPIAEPELEVPDLRAWQQLDADRHLAWFEEALAAPVAGATALRRLDPSSDGLITTKSGVPTADLDELSQGMPGSIALAASAAALAPWFDGVVELCFVASTRDHPLAQDLVGYLLNPVPLRIAIDPSDTVAELHERAGSALADALTHRSVPFAEVRSHMQKAGLQTPDSRFLVSLIDHESATFGGQAANYRLVFTGKAVADASFFLNRSGGAVSLQLEFDGQAVGCDSAQVLMRRFERAVHALHHDRATSVADLVPAKLRSFAHGGPATGPTWVLDRIIERTTAREHTPALTCDGHELTWSQLGSRAAHVAAVLERRGLEPGQRVLVHLAPSELVPVAMLGVLAAGGVYVPIDPGHPVGRRRAAIRAADADFILIEDGVPDDVDATTLIASRDQFDGEPWSDDLELTRNPTIAASDPAYIIFTSGSTGTPNGVAITHDQISKSTAARSQVYEQPPERFLLLSSPAFDSSMVGLFWTLAHGETLLIAPAAMAADPDALVGLIGAEQPTHLLTVPTLYRLLLGRSKPTQPWVSHAIVAGEACHRDLARIHFEQFPGAALTNEYGPTEATVWASAHHLDRNADGAVPIGPPIPGTWIAVIDANARVCEQGVAGQLLLGGVLVSDGYLGNHDHPAFESMTTGLPATATGRTFLTGDQAVMRDGTIWFLGRVDDQLNIGGIRVDPGLVESALSQASGVMNVAVLATDRRGFNELIEFANSEQTASAMQRALASAGPADEALLKELRSMTSARLTVTAHIEGQTVDEAELRSLAAEHLPSTARPTEYVFHDVLPRGPTGKIDRTSLQRVTRSSTQPAIRDSRPRTASGLTPEAVASIFGRVLGRNDIDVHQSFFDAGGDSLAAFEVVRLLERELGHALMLRAVHESPTAYELARSLDTTQSRATGELDGDMVAQTLSSSEEAQHHAFFLHHIGPAGVLATGLAEALGDTVSMTTVIDARSVHMPFEQPRPGTRFASVCELSGAYANEIERLRPVGPVVVIGFCQGGIYAHDVAAELERRGRSVELLVCIRDWHAPDGGHLPIDRSTGAIRLVGRTVEQLLVGRQSLGSFFGSKFRRLAAYVSDAARIKTPWSHTHRIGARTFADHEAHTFESHSVPTLIVRSSHDPYTPSSLGQQGWASVLDDYEVTYVPGDPSIGGVVADVADRIREALRGSDAISHP